MVGRRGWQPRISLRKHEQNSVDWFSKRAHGLGHDGFEHPANRDMPFDCVRIEWVQSDGFTLVYLPGASLGRHQLASVWHYSQSIATTIVINDQIGGNGFKATP